MRTRIYLLSAVVALSVLVGCGNKTAPGRASTSKASRDKAPVSKTSKPAKDNTAGKLPFTVPQSTPNINDLLTPKGLNTATAPVAGPKVAPVVPGKRPTAQQLLAAVRMRYATAKTVRINAVSSMLVTADGKTVGKVSSQRSVLTFKRPNMFAIRGGQQEMISNGKTLYTYVPKAKRFGKTQLDKKAEQQILRGLITGRMGVGSFGMIFGVDYQPAFSSMKLLNDAKVSGKDTYVLSLRLKKGVGIPSKVDAVQTLWIGKDDFAIYKNQVVSTERPIAPKGYKGKLPKLIRSTDTLIASKCEFNGKIPDSSFAFNPPSGAKPFENPMRDVVQNKPAPDFAFTWTDGSKKSLSDFRSRVVLLDLWGMPMCEKHLPVLQKVYNQYKDVQVISICLNTDAAKIKKYMSEKGLTFPVVFATEDMAKVLAGKYNLRTIPTVFIIDKAGIARSRFIGNTTQADISAKLDKVGA
ncbi:MAG: redoxin domain-containing protein [Armatimonadota bacterium]|nr:redoxin domain-containing protein [bacterium]